MTPAEVALLRSSIAKFFGKFTPPASQAINNIPKRPDVAAKGLPPPRSNAIPFFSIVIPKQAPKSMKTAA